MEIALLIGAYGLGFLVTLVRLPPMVGYLIAGFVLHAFDYESTEAIETIADIGIYLLLFAIGLKLNPLTLVKPEVIGTASIFAVIATLVPAAVLMLASVIGLPLADDLSLGSALMVAFGLSFSSTVFAVKALERTNETTSFAGRIAIGVLIIQDILAVGFLVFIDASWPSPWLAVVIVGLLLARPLFGWLLDRSGHGELMVLLGFALTIGGGAELFSTVDLKPDLGALFVGLVLSRHPRAAELSERLISFKDLFLVGFFLSIGLAGAPSGSAWFFGVALVVLVPTRSAVLYVVLTRFRLRARTALNTALTLSTFSEFGLIVVAAAVDEGRLDSQWLAVLAVAVSGSFVVASATNALRYQIYDRWRFPLVRLERTPHLADDAVVDIGNARVLVFGMGRIGTGAYDELIDKGLGPVVGVEREAEVVARHNAAGRRVIQGDALDRDFCERVSLHPEVELVFAATNNHAANILLARRMQIWLPEARLASIAQYSDQIDELRDAGVDVARNLFEEAGQALADDAIAAVWPPDQ